MGYLRDQDGHLITDQNGAPIADQNGAEVISTSINSKTVAVIPFNPSPDDKFLVYFDIEEWLVDATISSVVFSAVDKFGDDATAAVLPGGNAYTNTIILSNIAGGTANVSYTAKLSATISDGSVKNFYIKWFCREVAS